MLRNFLTKVLPSSNSLFVPVRTNVFKAGMIEPIVVKEELDSISSEDDRHYVKVKPPNTTQSNSILYNQRLEKFTKLLMHKGEYSIARDVIEKTFYKIKLVQIEKRNKETDEEKRSLIEANPLKVFIEALDNCKPLLKIVTVKKGGLSYKCPVPMSDKEREFKGTKFLINSCLEKDKTIRFYEVLAYELIEASLNQGKSIKKKTDMHRLAEQNRAYAHYRWSK